MVTYSKLANLDIVDTKGFLFFSGTKPEGRKELSNKVEAAENETSTDK